MMRNLAAPAVLLAAVTLVYWNSFPGDFHYDDYAHILDDPSIAGGSFPYGWFLSQYGGRPLTLWTFFWNHRVFAENPTGYLILNLGLHGLVVLGLWFLILGHFRDRVLAFGSALIFALHPLQTQTVNYVWSRSLLLMAVFSLAALMLVQRHPMWALLLTQLAIWSRAEALVLVPMLILLDRSRWKPFGLLAGINMVMLLVSMALYRHPDVAWNHSDSLAFFAAQPVALLTYLRLMVWPSDLHIDRDFSQPEYWLVIIACLLIVVAGWLAWRFRQSHPVPVLGLLWILIWLSPSMLIPNADIVTESRAYLSLAGFGLILSWGALSTLGKISYGAVSGVVLIALLMVPATLGRNRLWRDDVALYRDAARKSPNKSRVHYNLGSALARSGLVAQAEREFRQSVVLRPEDDLGYSALGYCAEVQDRREEAESYYHRALELNPDNARAADGLYRLRPQY